MRHGPVPRVLRGSYMPSRLGTFIRAIHAVPAPCPGCASPSVHVPRSCPRPSLAPCPSPCPTDACRSPTCVPGLLHVFQPVPTRPGPSRCTAALTDALWSLPTLRGLRPHHRHVPRAPAMHLARPSRTPAPATISRTRCSPLQHVPAHPFSTCRRCPASSPVPAAPSVLGPSRRAQALPTHAPTFT